MISSRLHLARRHIGFLACLSLAAVTHAATPQYTAVDLGALGGTTPQAYVYGINNAGTVVGWSTTATSGEARAFTYRNGVMTALGVLSGGKYAKAFGLNEAGIVVGMSAISYGSHAVSFSNGSVNDLGSLGGKDAQANAINSAGTIVGNSQIANGAVHAFSYSNGVMTDLGTLGGTHSQAYGINDSGTIVGTSNTASGATHAFSYSNGVMTDLGTFTGTASGANVITNDGTIGGYFSFLSGDRGGFILRNGTVTGFGSSSGETSDINTAGVAVGKGNFNYGPVKAIRYSAGLMIDLNTLIAPLATPLTSAKGVNDSGLIVAQANLRSYLLIPIPAPGSYAAWVAQNSLTGPSAEVTAILTDDGVTNLMKFALGLPALQPAVPDLPKATLESGQLVFRYSQALILSGVTTTVQTSTDLVQWATAAESPVVESSTATTQTLKVTFTASQPTLFARLVVTQP